MKLSSISLIAAALAIIAGSTAAAPAALRPAEKNLFERDVDIYSRGLHYEPEADRAVKCATLAIQLARQAGQQKVAEHHEKYLPRLQGLKDSKQPSRDDLDFISRRIRAANNAIERYRAGNTTAG